MEMKHNEKQIMPIMRLSGWKTSAFCSLLLCQGVPYIQRRHKTFASLLRDFFLQDICHFDGFCSSYWHGEEVLLKHMF